MKILDIGGKNALICTYRAYLYISFIKKYIIKSPEPGDGSEKEKEISMDGLTDWRTDGLINIQADMFYGIKKEPLQIRRIFFFQKSAKFLKEGKVCIVFITAVVYIYVYIHIDYLYWKYWK